MILYEIFGFGLGETYKIITSYVLDIILNTQKKEFHVVVKYNYSLHVLTIPVCEK